MSSKTLSLFTSLVWLIIALISGLRVSKAEIPLQNIQIQSEQQLREAAQSFDLARQIEASGNIEQALTIYYRLVEEFPGTLSYYQQLKQVLRNSARYSELHQVIDNHIRLNPNDLQSFVELGDVQLALGQDSLALQTWESVLGRFPGNVLAERLVLTHIFSNNLLEEGKSQLERLRTIKSDSSFFSLDMGYLYTLRMDYSLATDEFLLHLSAQPQTITTVTNQILRFPSEPEVVSMLREKLQRNGSTPALSILASVEFQNRNFQQVIDLYVQLEVQPEGWFNLGRDLMAEEELGLAQDVMERILSNPDAISLYEQCILVLAEIEDPALVEKEKERDGQGAKGERDEQVSHPHGQAGSRVAGLVGVQPAAPGHPRLQKHRGKEGRNGPDGQFGHALTPCSVSFPAGRARTMRTS